MASKDPFQPTQHVEYRGNEQREPVCECGHGLYAYHQTPGTECVFYDHDVADDYCDCGAFKIAQPAEDTQP